jgi:uncharacterized Zn finger protein (UPF0148 family)
MSDTDIPIAEIKPLCPQCGAELLIEHDGIEPKPEDRVFCPVHGTVGTREEIHARILEQHRDQIADHVSDAVRKMLKDSGFDPN